MGTLFCYAKNDNHFLETPVAIFFILPIYPIKLRAYSKTKAQIKVISKNQLVTFGFKKSRFTFFAEQNNVPLFGSFSLP